ncbi:MAG: IS630 family transposase, partial [candidate division Zixibacteria bacterium]|nr:IS630 family transposase [candidate division Zixibacteria bacterium]
MLLHKAGIPASRISWYIDRDVSTVQRWIPRVENNILDDIRRSGRPPLFTQEMQLKTIGFYCQAKPAPGCSHWTLTWAVNHLNNDLKIIGRPISRSTIRRFLESNILRPHKSRYFLNITDPDFFPKMEHILGLYANPPKNLFLFDECTGIQALSRCAPDSFRSDHSRNRESHYSRNGRTNLIAFMNHRTGKIFGRCTSKHDTEKFIEVFLEHVKSQPENESLHYICDNYSTHYTEKLCQKVAELCNVVCPKLKYGKDRREWLQSEDKRIVIHFLPFHGSWLNMIEIWFGIMKQKTLDNGWFENGEALINQIMDFISTWNAHYLHPFEWNYTGEGLQALTLRRFNRLLKSECKQIDCSFLKSQLLLMKNIGHSYRKQIPDEDWLELVTLINDKNDFIQSIISNTTKPKVKVWTQ